jgi:hypothetical protein
MNGRNLVMTSLSAEGLMIKRDSGFRHAAGSLVDAGNRYAAWFHELDAWICYWDIYHPETAGRHYFGNGSTEQGLLRRFLPRENRPAVFNAWVRMALSLDNRQKFIDEARMPEVAAAVLEIDRLFSRLFKSHFGNAADPGTQADYINAMLCFGCNTLPPASDRAAQIAADDPRKASAGRYCMDADLMWFCWALHLEAVHAVIGVDEEHARRSLMLAGICVGCSSDFIWSGRRRSRPEYSRDFQTAYLLRNMGAKWADDFDEGRAEVHALFRIREWGHEQ